MSWVKLKKYCENSGDTADAVHSRRKRGLWLDGKHCQVKQRRLWINTEEVAQWITGKRRKRTPSALPRG